MSHVLSPLSHADLAAVSRSCTALRAQAMLTVPGLSLHLYPHQVACMHISSATRTYLTLHTLVVTDSVAWSTQTSAQDLSSTVSKPSSKVQLAVYVIGTCPDFHLACPFHLWSSCCAGAHAWASLKKGCSKGSAQRMLHGKLNLEGLLCDCL